MLKKSDFILHPAIENIKFDEKHFAQLCEQAATALTSHAIWQTQSTPAAANILLSDDAHIQTLNKTYRGKDKPTNVLSFPDGSALNGEIQLGDIILALPTIQKEAGESGISVEHHLTHLILHGLLHLLGYDHETDAEAEKMEAIEIEMLAKLGIKSPY